MSFLICCILQSETNKSFVVFFCPGVEKFSVSENLPNVVRQWHISVYNFSVNKLIKFVKKYLPEFGAS